jgi:Ni,Fe-hydrogenase maturation factor
MEGPRHPFDYQPEVPNIEAFTLFLNDIKQMEPADRSVILDSITAGTPGVLTIKTRDQGEKKVSFVHDMNQDDRINATLDAVEHLAEIIRTRKTTEPLGEQEGKLTAAFEPYI